jgi:hypothetical protein
MPSPFLASCEQQCAEVELGPLETSLAAAYAHTMQKQEQSGSAEGVLGFDAGVKVGSVKKGGKRRSSVDDCVCIAAGKEIEDGDAVRRKRKGTGAHQVEGKTQHKPEKKQKRDKVAR